MLANTSNNISYYYSYYGLTHAAAGANSKQCDVHAARQVNQLEELVQQHRRGGHADPMLDKVNKLTIKHKFNFKGKLQIN